MWYEEDFLGDISDFYKHTMWNVAVDGMPLKRYKRNWHDTYGLSENWKVLLYAFFFLSGETTGRIGKPRLGTFRQ